MLDSKQYTLYTLGIFQTANFKGELRGLYIKHVKFMGVHFLNKGEEKIFGIMLYRTKIDAGNHQHMIWVSYKDLNATSPQK